MHTGEVQGAIEVKQVMGKGVEGTARDCGFKCSLTLELLGTESNVTVTVGVGS